VIDCSALFKEVGEEGFLGWEEAIGRVVNNYGCRLTENFFVGVDNYLAGTREKDLRLVGYRSKAMVSKHGQLNIRRRLYRDRAGNYRFLLDEALGLAKRRAMTPQVASYAATLAAHVPFRVAEDLIKRAFGAGPSHQSIHNLVARFGEDQLDFEELERLKLFGFGELPKSEAKQAENLFLEADGVNISLQREKSKRCEVKVGVAYTGKEGEKTLDKVIHLDLDEGEPFWQGLTVKVAKVFDLAALRQATIGGDGAAFVRIGQKLFSGASFRIDPFHVARAIKGVLGWTKASYQATQEAFSGNVTAATALLDQAGANSDENKRRQIARVKRYLKNNADGLGAGPSLGTIETNVDKLVANRMKKRGMAWTKTGARRMLKLLEKKALGNFDNLLVTRPAAHLSEKPKEQVSEILRGDPQDWLDAHIAAFDGPHAGRPWVKLLRQIARGQELQLTGFVPTKT
jgi:hypothetical protein